MTRHQMTAPTSAPQETAPVGREVVPADGREAPGNAGRRAVAGGLVTTAGEAMEKAGLLSAGWAQQIALAAELKRAALERVRARPPHPERRQDRADPQTLDDWADQCIAGMQLAWASHATAIRIVDAARRGRDDVVAVIDETPDLAAPDQYQAVGTLLDGLPAECPPAARGAQVTAATAWNAYAREIAIARRARHVTPDQAGPGAAGTQRRAG
jgi:hypothetical protein